MPGWTAITGLWLVIFSRTSGCLSVKVDDIFFLSRTFTPGDSYLQIMAQRGFLTRFYAFLHDLLGQDLARDYWFFFFLLLISALLFFSILHRLLDPFSALFASLFYLAYAGKHETLFWISAGAYLVVMIVFFLSALIAISGLWGPWRRAALITFLNWPAVHLYEIAIMAAPLYPLLLVLHRKAGRKPLFARELIPAFLPMLMFLTHWVLLYFGASGQPIWIRHAIRTSPQALVERMANALYLGVHASIGYSHVMEVRTRLNDFFSPPWETGSSARFAGAMILAVAAFVWACKRSPRIRSSIPASIWLPLAAGSAYMLFLGPAVGFTIIDINVASRLLSLPGAGLAGLMGIAVAACLGTLDLTGSMWASAGSLLRRLRILLIPLVICLILAEAFALNANAYTGAINWRHDTYLRRQFQATGMRLSIGDTVFVSFPRAHPAWGDQRFGLSEFEGIGGQLILLLDANLVKGHSAIPPLERFHYIIERRSNGATRLPIPAELLSRSERVFPFFVQPGWKLTAIRRAEYVDASGKLVRAIDFPAVAGLNTPTMVVQVPR